MRLPRPVTLAAPLLFGVPTLLCLVLSTGWWKIGAAVPIALLAGALSGCRFIQPDRELVDSRAR